MRNIWLTSDTHFGHENIIRYCNRPFANAKEMDDAIRTKWNETVKDGDIVYHLGDVYFGAKIGNNEEPEDFLKTLKGRKRLLLGNHDELKNGVLQRSFQKVGLWRKFSEFGLILTHVPVHESTLYETPDANFPCYINVHGHIHDKAAPSGMHFNASVEWLEYGLINVDEIR